ncbi:MAG TPA: alpha/beta fold hydrolase, partial [Dehalococcoidia bacterium]|nr:alpha/beta fold hydrolase [Dehalococcoidia bacterium]
MDRRIRFCTMASGARIAYATSGAGPAIVITQGLAGHLELFWEHPASRYMIETLARHHLVVEYDRYGTGLSDRDRTDFTIEADVQALAAVVEALKLKQFALMGHSGSGPVVLAYAVQHPRQVAQLILSGTFGWPVSQPTTYQQVWQAATLAAEAHRELGSRMLADIMMPEADAASRAWFARFTREGASPEMAAALRGVSPDLRPLLGKLRMPTLVLHRRGDQAVAFERGRELASALPNAQFVSLEGTEHIPSSIAGRQQELQAVLQFLGAPVDDAAVPVDSIVTGPPPSAASRPRPHAVFVSYAAEDRASAEVVVQTLEAAGTACWIAPRDIPPGADYAEAIIDAIRASRALLLLFSAHANRSPHVRREVERATSADLSLLPVRLDAT